MDAFLDAEAVAGIGFETEEDDEPRSREPTSAGHCKVHGSGLEICVVRQAASFTLETYTASGERQTTGGDQIFISIRGCGDT